MPGTFPSPFYCVINSPTVLVDADPSGKSKLIITLIVEGVGISNRSMRHVCIYDNIAANVVRAHVDCPNNVSTDTL
eukprot:15351168-Ditylum_brightwellii.AAC.1